MFKPIGLKSEVVSGVQFDALQMISFSLWWREEGHIAGILPIRKAKRLLPGLQKARTKYYRGELSDRSKEKLLTVKRQVECRFARRIAMDYRKSQRAKVNIKSEGKKGIWHW